MGFIHCSTVQIELNNDIGFGIVNIMTN
uniref:Uncharacterized protein n=1 Tax=Arundo donax TaxID=35708 RepID=A0A0A9A9K3_ARUDO